MLRGGSSGAEVATLSSAEARLLQGPPAPKRRRQPLISYSLGSHHCNLVLFTPQSHPTGSTRLFAATQGKHTCMLQTWQAASDRMV